MVVCLAGPGAWIAGRGQTEGTGIRGWAELLCLFDACMDMMGWLTGFLVWDRFGKRRNFNCNIMTEYIDFVLKSATMCRVSTQRIRPPPRVTCLQYFQVELFFYRHCTRPNLQPPSADAALFKPSSRGEAYVYDAWGVSGVACRASCNATRRVQYSSRF